jgi:hypothetical protein
MRRHAGELRSDPDAWIGLGENVEQARVVPFRYVVATLAAASLGSSPFSSRVLSAECSARVARPLGRVHGPVGVPEQRLDITAMLRVQREPNARPNPNGVSVEHERMQQCLLERFSRLTRGTPAGCGW